MPLFNEFSISLASELFRMTNHSVLKKMERSHKRQDDTADTGKGYE